MIEALTGNELSYRALLKEAAIRLHAYYAPRIAAVDNAEDLVQETLIALHTRRFTYDRARPFPAWLHAIARYKLIDYLRQRRAFATVPAGPGHRLGDP